MSGTGLVLLPVKLLLLLGLLTSLTSAGMKSFVGVLIEGASGVIVGYDVLLVKSGPGIGLGSGATAVPRVNSGCIKLSLVLVLPAGAKMLV